MQRVLSITIILTFPERPFPLNVNTNFFLFFSVTDNRYRVDNGVAGINGKRHPDSSGHDEDENDNNNNNEVSYDASKSKAHPSGTQLHQQQQQMVIGMAGVVVVNVIIILTRNCLLEKHALIVN